MKNIQLTENFFQDYAKEVELAEKQPVLQILQSRKLEGGSICHRLRCSDGIFLYSYCGFDKNLVDRVEEDIVLVEEDTCPIVKVLSYRSTLSAHKNTFIITDYQLLATDVGKIGNPTTYSDNLETFRGSGSAKRKLEETSNASAAPTSKKVLKTAEVDGSIMPINSTSPYNPGRWKICGAATGIEPLRNINSKKGPMNVFSFVLTDKDGKSIKVTSFAEIAEKFHPQLRENGTYYISGGPTSVRAANRRFNSTGHEYELTLSHDSIIEIPAKQTYEPPKFVIRKTSLNQLSALSGQSVDILAIIDKVEDAVTIRKKDNTETLRRNIQLIDQSATSVALTLWGEQAQNFDGEEGGVIGIKNAFIREYMGTYSLSIYPGCRVEIDPESRESQELQAWFKGQRPNVKINSISAQAGRNNSADELRLFPFFTNPNLNIDSQRGIYFSNVSVITQIRSDNALYQSCAKNDCSKKVTESNGSYSCSANHKLPTFKHRYMVNMEIADICGSIWVTLFNDKAEPFFGKTAVEMGKLQQSDPDAYQAVFDSKMYTMHSFRCRGKNEVYNDVARLKYQVYEIHPPNFEQYGTALDAAINKLEAL